MIYGTIQARRCEFCIGFKKLNIAQAAKAHNVVQQCYIYLRRIKNLCIFESNITLQSRITDQNVDCIKLNLSITEYVGLRNVFLQIKMRETTDNQHQVSLFNEDQDEENVLQAMEEINLSDLKYLDDTAYMLSEALVITFLNNWNEFFQIVFGFNQQLTIVLLTIPYVVTAFILIDLQ